MHIFLFLTQIHHGTQYKYIYNFSILQKYQMNWHQGLQTKLIQNFHAFSQMISNSIPFNLLNQKKNIYIWCRYVIYILQKTETVSKFSFNQKNSQNSLIYTLTIVKIYNDINTAFRSKSIPLTHKDSVKQKISMNFIMDM